MQKLIRTVVALAAVGALVTVLPTKADAQQTASNTIDVFAVVSDGLQVLFERDLSFGTVFPGLSSIVSETDATSGHLQVLGGSGAEVSLTFPSLPTTLDLGVESMPVSFTATYNQTDAGGTGTSFAPSSGATTTLDVGTGQLHVYIGGTVTASDPQVPGTYSAIVTLQATYTGN